MTNELNLPWHYDGRYITDNKGEFPLVQPNAAYICKAVNMHGELIAHLQQAQRFIAAVVAERDRESGEGTSTLLDNINELLERAKG